VSSFLLIVACDVRGLDNVDFRWTSGLDGIAFARSTNAPAPRSTESKTTCMDFSTCSFDATPFHVRIVAVEGNIAAGKTTLLEQLTHEPARRRHDGVRRGAYR